MGASWHCPHEQKQERNPDGTILCGKDGMVCPHQQYCPSKRRCELTVASSRCNKRKAAESRKG